MYMRCFEKTGKLLQFTKSDADKKIKPQCVVSEIIIPLTYANIEDQLDFYSQEPLQL